jgi:tRNA U55 pseudouridine synthase TruB
MTSAVKVEGERLYKRAHRGEEIETPTRTVTVHRAELQGSDPERATFEIECSSGTYVRTLIETLEDAYCESLRRLAIGPFQVPDGGDEQVSLEDLAGFLPERTLSTDERLAVSHGRPVTGGVEVARGSLPNISASEASRLPRASLDDPRFRLTHEGRLIAIARQDGENLRPEVVLT